MRPPALAAVEAALEAAYIAADGASLRDEDRRKARQIEALLGEVALAAAACAKRRALVVVDAAAGKAYAGLLAAHLLFAPAGRAVRVVVLEREAARVAACAGAAARLGVAGVELACGDVGDATLWPDEPDVVVALHACGAAADRVIDAAVAARARHLLLVPCCYDARLDAHDAARRTAEALRIPPHAPVRRRFMQACVDAERTLRLEAAGYETRVVELVAATVTPHNLLWRARRVGEPRRMERARQDLRELWHIL